jgi:hypothetical protein
MDVSVYEHLDRLNKNLCETLAVLTRLNECRELRGLQFRTHFLRVKELRALVSQEVTEALNERELQNAGRFWRQRRTLEKRLKRESAVLGEE